MDDADLTLLKLLQKDADMPLSHISQLVGMSKTACWNRLQRLEERGILKGKMMVMDRHALSLPVTVFLSITVGQHSPAWVEEFQTVVSSYPEIMEVHRLTGEGTDYQLKIVCPSIEAYDAFQQSIIGKIRFTSMATKIALNEIKTNHNLPLSHLAPATSPSPVGD